VGVRPSAAAHVGAPGGPNVVRVHRDDRGFKLQVDGRDFMVFGMNWDYMPVGENYTYDFWGKPDAIIEEALRREMTLLRDMGVNAIRVGIEIPPRWVTHIYEKYGVYSIINHYIGRYGFMVDGVWRSPIDYADPYVREVIEADVLAAVERFRGTPGVLMWLLGNENNYGLYWASAEIENLPLDRQNDTRAVFLYTLFGQIIDRIKATDDLHPVAMANGDLQYLDLIAAHCKNLDIMGANVYRGPISGDVFQRVRDELGKPFLYTEFGADAYDAKRHREDGFPQAEIQRSLWKEIYEQSHGKGGAGTAIGGLIFQWGDGWWKYKQDVNLDVHDPTASWSNGGYTSDFVEGENNMNEEWFGITAKTRNDELGLYVSKPRPAYYVLQRAFQLDPYAPTTDLARVRAWFDSLDVRAIAVGFDAERRIEELEGTQRLRLSQLRLDFETYTTWGSGLSTAEGAREKRRFDHTESLYAEVEAKPVDGLSAKVSVNVLGGVAKNPVDEIFYERRSLPVTVEGSDGKDVTLTDRSRIALYQASLGWENPYLRLEGFYRVGHFHWGYEGDFFGLYREAYHQEAVDMYDAAAPSGFILSGKRGLDGLTLAFGPEIYWGANPMILAKYWRTIGAFSFSLMHQEDVAQQTPSAVSSVVPEPQTRKSTLYLAWTRGMLKFEGGGILAGTDRIDRPFVRVEEAPTGEPSYLGSGYYVLDDQIRMVDTLGAKLKVSLTHPMSSWFVQGSYRGLVTDAGPDPTITYTGFSLKESGQGNHTALTAGGVLNVGFIQVAPLFLYQKPLVGPVPRIDDYFDADTGKYYPGTRPRNQLGDPFWVRSNRETVAFELLLNWDPTPATWLWAWDNIRREDAPIAASLDFVYRIQPTAMDAALGYTTDGVQFAFDGSAPAKDLWELKARLMINPTRDLHIVAWLWGGNGQSNGSDPRLIERFGGNTRVTYGRAVFEGAVKVDDWGPYDYHRDYNLTYPLQVTGDASWSFGMPEWLVIAYSRAGVRVKYRTLDEFSPRVALDLMDPASASGREWEVKSYVQLSL
jgi:beta-galactosidase